MSASLDWNSSALLSKSLSLLRLARRSRTKPSCADLLPRRTQDSIISPICNNMRNRPADLSLASFGVAPGARLARGLLLFPSHH